MAQEKSENVPPELTPYDLAKRLSESRHSSSDYIERLEARLAALEADRRSSMQREAHPPQRSEIVILVHGIRDRALWQTQVRSSLRSAGFDVALTNYGRFDVFRFLLPVPIFRRSVIKKIRDQIRSIKLLNPASDVSIIAHSFGTYVISRVMHEEFDIIFKRVVFCGGVFSQKMPFEQFSNRFSPPILNEVGAEDFWPAIANSITWGYGAPGTFGFRRPLFEDRWHSEKGHSFYLTKAFCDQYWIPFLSDGRVVGGEDLPRTPHWSVELISNFHLKYAVILVTCLIFIAIERHWIF